LWTLDIISLNRSQIFGPAGAGSKASLCKPGEGHLIFLESGDILFCDFVTEPDQVHIVEYIGFLYLTRDRIWKNPQLSANPS
jgi:hypothetical protein